MKNESNSSLRFGHLRCQVAADGTFFSSFSSSSSFLHRSFLSFGPTRSTTFGSSTHGEWQRTSILQSALTSIRSHDYRLRREAVCPLDHRVSTDSVVNAVDYLSLQSAREAFRISMPLSWIKSVDTSFYRSTGFSMECVPIFFSLKH